MTQNLILFGDCEKHDFAIAAATLIEAYTGKTARIVTDEDQHYRYFEGAVGQIGIDVDVLSDKADYVLWDFHYEVPQEAKDENLLLVTTFEKRALASAERVMSQMVPQAFCLIVNDSKITPRYVQKVLPYQGNMIIYEDSPARRIDWVHDQQMNFKVEKDFQIAVQDFVQVFLDVPEKELKKLWSIAAKKKR